MGKTAIVYRVEHKRTGDGPWTHYGWSGFRSYDGHTPGDLPPPCEDGLGWPSSCEHCACASVSKLKRWFHDPHLRDLEEGGFVVRRYRVPRNMIRRGRHQVLFVREHSDVVGEYAPTRYVGA